MLQRIITAALSGLLAACSVAGQTAEPEASGPIKAQTARATSSSVGTDGATLTATAADGTRYTLEIPAAALMAPVEITMTPVSRIDGLGLSGGLAGAVELQPPGTQLARAATLRIETSRTAPEGQRLAGFSTSDDLAIRSLAPAAADGGTVSVFVFHFSTAGAGFGTTQDVTQFSVGSSVSLDTYMSDVLGFGQPWNDTTWDIALGIGHDSFAQIVLPGLESATNDNELLLAVANYDHWRSLIDLILNRGVPMFGDPAHTESIVFSGERASANAAAHPKLLQAEIGNVQTCGDQASLEALANVLFWQGQAALFDRDDAASGLDLASVLEDIRNDCAVVEPIGSDLPAELPVGSPVNVELGIGLRYANGDQKFVPAEVTLTSSNATIQSASTTTDGAGLFRAVVTATAGPPVTIHGRACVILPNSFVTSPVCGDFTVSGSAGGPPGSGGPAGSGGSGTLPDISGTYLVSVFCNRAGEVGNLGAGSGTVTQSGATVSMIWSVSFAGAGQPSCGGSPVGNLPAGGSFAGHLELLPPDPRGAQGIDIVVDSGCPGAAGDLRLRYGMRSFFVPPCPISQAVAGGGVLYEALWQGP